MAEVTNVNDLFLRPPWPHQRYAVEKVLEYLEAGEDRICVGSPTGLGKTIVQIALIFHWLEQGKKVVIYQSRRALIDQFIRVFEENHVPFGVRSAAHKDHRRLLEDIQISSMQTEQAWVYNSGRYDLHKADYLIVDEIHLQKAKTAERLIKDHNCPVIGFTATPMGVNHLFNELIIAGSKEEGRKCGALVPAVVYTGEEIDTSTLEDKNFSQPDVAKLYTPKVKAQIIGSVLDNYKRHNPERTPTLLFAPGVAESLWFAQQFEKAGIKAAHIDGKDVYVDGEDRATNEAERAEIFKRFREGDIKVITNRFVLREGIDLPEITHLILATAFGSMVSYIQSVGRVLRAHPSMTHATIIDHGCNWARFDSPNEDPDWHDLWEKTPYQVLANRKDAFREGEAKEPIACPNCGQVRRSSLRECTCGHVYGKSVRRVIQSDGTLKEVEGQVFKPRNRQMRRNTQQIWERMYHRARQSRNKMTFRQAEGLFAFENYYWPPTDLPLMPKRREDWGRRVCETPRDQLQ